MGRGRTGVGLGNNMRDKGRSGVLWTGRGGNVMSAFGLGCIAA